jgi:CRP/FNR family transcriptional regulator, cyclic AMP receptor protein
VTVDVRWWVEEELQLAVLDEESASSVARWPAIAAALLSRPARRAGRLAFLAAVLENPRLDVRLLLMFWHLAERWGRVRPTRVVVPVDVTHNLLGRLVRGQRPSVTASLQKLAQRGMLTRRENGEWVLHGNPDEQLRLLWETS